MRPLLRNGSLLLGAALLCACPGPSPSRAKVAAQVSQSMERGTPGHELAMQAIGCWLGGLWAEAEGYLPPDRGRVTEVRCREVLRRVYNDGRDRYRQMRDMDRDVVDAVARKAGEAAAGGRTEIIQLVRAVADAEREELEARRAAAEIRRNLNDPKELTSLDWKEIQALSRLRRSGALGRLLQAELGPHSDDARVLALLVAIDRVEIVRTVPRHLAPYAIEGVARHLFSIDLPEAVSDPTKPLPEGAWLQYMTDVARAAGHPVPDEIQRPEDRNLLAFAGILKALADRLRQELARMPADAEPTLRRIVESTARRIDVDYAEAHRAARAPKRSRST